MKLIFFDALVLSRAQRRRLDCFSRICVRRQIGIPASFFSQVSNEPVLYKAGVLSYGPNVALTVGYVRQDAKVPSDS